MMKQRNDFICAYMYIYGTGYRTALNKYLQCIAYNYHQFISDLIAQYNEWRKNR